MLLFAKGELCFNPVFANASMQLDLSNMLLDAAFSRHSRLTTNAECWQIVHAVLSRICPES
jgi:hypothetical protein